MPSLKDLRNRIASVKSTQKITKAMQMVAASKLRRAQAAAEAARPFANKVETVLSNLAGKTVKILCIGKKGYDQLKRTHEKQILEMIDLRAVRAITYATAQPIATKVMEM